MEYQTRRQGAGHPQPLGCTLCPPCTVYGTRAALSGFRLVGDVRRAEILDCPRERCDGILGSTLVAEREAERVGRLSEDHADK